MIKYISGDILQSKDEYIAQGVAIGSQAQFAVQLAQQEDLDLGAGLLLVAVQTGREDLGVVEDEEVLFVEILDDILEDAVFDGAFGAVDDHQARVVPVFRRMFRQHFGGEFVPVL